jgi:hypothetical protein
MGHLMLATSPRLDVERREIHIEREECARDEWNLPAVERPNTLRSVCQSPSSLGEQAKRFLSTVGLDVLYQRTHHHR